MHARARAREQISTKMAVALMPNLLQTLTAAIQVGGGVGAAEAARAAARVRPKGTWTLGKDKLKRPKRRADGHKDAENKMRFRGITDSVQKLNFRRRKSGTSRCRSE